MKIKSATIELLNEFFDELEGRNFAFPNFLNSTEVVIFSDYAGERPEDEYYAYSFYLIDSATSIDATSQIMALRNKEPQWVNNSFIEYKNVSKDKVRKRILPYFLNIFDNLDGLVITFLIDKKSPNYFLKVSDHQAELIKQLGLGSWKTEILRKSANILSLLALLVKRFLNEETVFTWYSDRDDIFGAEQSKKSHTLDMLSKFLEIYEVNIKENRVRFISDKETILNSDFLSVADLSAAAVLEYYQVGYQNGEMKDTTKTIIAWLSSNKTRLKKLMIVGEENGNNKQITALRNYD